MIQMHWGIFCLCMFASAYVGIGGMMAFAISNAGAGVISMALYLFLWPVMPGTFRAKPIDIHESDSHD